MLFRSNIASSRSLNLQDWCLRPVRDPARAPINSDTSSLVGENSYRPKCINASAWLGLIEKHEALYGDFWFNMQWRPGGGRANKLIVPKLMVLSSNFFYSRGHRKIHHSCTKYSILTEHP